MIFYMLINFCYAKHLTGEVSYENLINEFMGVWEVTSIQTYTSNAEYETSINLDYWTLEKNENNIILKNPISNAMASITIDEISNKTLKFIKISQGSFEKTIETPVITINGDTFAGTDSILIEKYNNQGNLIDKVEIKFIVYGKKLNN